MKTLIEILTIGAGVELALLVDNGLGNVVGRVMRDRARKRAIEEYRQVEEELKTQYMRAMAQQQQQAGRSAPKVPAKH